MKFMLAFIVTTAGLFAADATGTWTGTFTRDDGETGTAHLVLKQEGEKVTGTAGPDTDQQHQIENGKAVAGKITFEIPRENRTMKFVLAQEGDQIRGTISIQRDGELQTAELIVTRGK